MSINREEILADFQACTGIEDVGEAFMHLEDANWDLSDAVYRVLPQGSQELPSMPILDDSIQVIEEPSLPPGFHSTRHLSSPPNLAQLLQPVPLASISRESLPRRTRILNFSIVLNDTTTLILVPETQTVGMIKTLICSELGIPVCKQELSGWKLDRQPRDTTVLESLNLPKENTLYLSVNTDERDAATEESVARMTQTYRLSIFDITHNQTHTINFPGTKTLLEVKRDVSDLTGIPVRNQSWTGWPPLITDDLVLGASGINLMHDLTVKELVKEINRPPEVVPVPGGSNSEPVSDDGSTADEYEDASDVVMEDEFRELIPSRPQPLMPEGIEDETMAAIHFAEGFEQRYGPCHPTFFPGSLDDAMKEACHQPARDRKLLAVYLHHDGSVSSNVFCTQVLCSESIASFLSANFIIWGWDLTATSNRLRLLNTIARHFDSLASRTLRNFEVDKLPLLLIVTRSRATNEVLAMIPGSLNVDEMMTQLLHAVEMFSEQQRVEIAEEDERSARETVKREQDEAYQLSLEADRAKEELKRQGEAVKQRQEEEQRVKEEQEKRLIEFTQQQKEMRRQEVLKRLPAEPSADQSAGNITCIRFRLPEGKTSTRRFRADEPLQVLLDYLLVEGYPHNDFKVLSSWPRKDLTAVDSTETLRQLKLVPQETLIIEER
uniref:FAS-associated factor n=1 Tax=Daphnia magna TaxID=35525 RepID=A0A0P5N633_9CRUS